MKAIRFRMLTAVLTIALCSAFAVSQTARPAGHQGGGEHTLAFFTDYLDLTDAQQTQIKAILTKEKPIMAPMVQQLAATHSQLRQLEESAAFDENKARALAVAVDQNAQRLQTTERGELGVIKYAFDLMNPKMQSPMNASRHFAGYSFDKFAIGGVRHGPVPLSPPHPCQTREVAISCVKGEAGRGVAPAS